MKKGDRVKLSAEGLRRLHPNDAHVPRRKTGRMTKPSPAPAEWRGTARSRGRLEIRSVKWDHLKTVDYYHESFIEVLRPNPSAEVTHG
jgi:hypothetical protein